eukprot:752471-Pyramimonas_sp.AAC.1
MVSTETREDGAPVDETEAQQALASTATSTASALHLVVPLAASVSARRRAVVRVPIHDIHVLILLARPEHLLHFRQVRQVGAAPAGEGADGPHTRLVVADTVVLGRQPK